MLIGDKEEEPAVVTGDSSSFSQVSWIVVDVVGVRKNTAEKNR